MYSGRCRPRCLNNPAAASSSSCWDNRPRRTKAAVCFLCVLLFGLELASLPAFATIFRVGDWISGGGLFFRAASRGIPMECRCGFFSALPFSFGSGSVGFPPLRCTARRSRTGVVSRLATAAVMRGDAGGEAAGPAVKRVVVLLSFCFVSRRQGWIQAQESVGCVPSRCFPCVLIPLVVVGFYCDSSKSLMAMAFSWSEGWLLLVLNFSGDGVWGLSAAMMVTEIPLIFIFYSSVLRDLCGRWLEQLLLLYPMRACLYLYEYVDVCLS